MTPESPTALVRRYIDRIVNAGDLGLITECVAPSFINHLSDGSVVVGRDALTTMLTRMRADFRELQVTMTALSEKGECVVTCVAVHGTFRDPSIAPLNEWTWHGMITWRIHDGLIAERWVGLSDSSLY